MPFLYRLILILLLFVSILLVVRKTVKAPDSLEFSFTNTSQAKPSYSHNPKYAYVCLCANTRAVYPTLVLFQQLKAVQGNRGVHVALVSTEVSEEHLQVMHSFNITTVSYAPRSLFKIAYEPHSRSTWERDRILWQKLRVWGLTDFEKVIMLDYDLLLLKNFDELFDQEELSGVPMLFDQEKVAFWKDPLVGDPVESAWSNLQKIVEPRVGWTGLNSGVLVLKPSADTFNALIDAASKMKERTCCPSQEFIFRFFELRGQYNRLPAIYNLRKIHLLAEEEQRHYKETVKIYHFVEKKKPIVMGKKQAEGDPLASLWWKHASAVDDRLEALEVASELVRSIRIEAIKSALS